MIRDATPDDIPALLALGQRMHAESPRFSKLRFDPQTLRGTLEGVLSNPLGFLVVDELAGQIRGVFVGLAFQHWCSTDLVAVDLALFVEPQFRGTTIGPRLLQRYKAWASEVGAVLITAGVSTGVLTEQTARLYELQGFRRFGVLLEI